MHMKKLEKLFKKVSSYQKKKKRKKRNVKNSYKKKESEVFFPRQNQLIWNYIIFFIQNFIQSVYKKQ